MRRIRRFAALLMAVCIIASSVPVISAAQIENAGNDMDGASLRTSVEASGTGSVGRMLADAISEEQAALQASESLGYLGYAITNLTVTGSRIDVSCRSDKTVCVMVALYEESGELASFGSANAEAGEQTVTVGVSDDIPEFFTASAFMIDPETRTPLCAKYTTTLYTKAMRELSDASIDDYDANLVLNLDDDSDNNFAVFDESVHVIPYQSHVNQITDNGNGNYTITAANTDITSLRRGDIFAALSDNEDTLIIQIDQIHVMNGSTVFITQTDKELELADVFQVVKIEGGCLLDENGEIPEEARVASLMDTGVETKFLDKKPFQWEKEFKGGPGGMDVTVGLEGTVNATAKVKLYFMSEEQYFEAKVSFSSEFKASISGSSGRLTIPLLPEIVSFSPVPGLYISLNPSIVLEASVEMEFSAKATASVGFAYLGGANFENRSESPKIENVSLKAEGKLYIGFSLEPKIKIAGKVHLLKWELEIAEASITAEFGVTFSVSMEHDFLNKEHICLQCLKGTAKFSLELSAQAKLAKHFSPKVQLYKGDLETFNCYYSVDYDEFGFGECPHKQYLVTVLVKLPSGSPGGNLAVKATGKSVLSETINKESATDTQGKAEIYLPNGAYMLTCETADYSAKGETALTVDGKKTDAAIQLSVNVHTVTFNANGGTVTAGSMTVASGQTLSRLPTATRNGYTFNGWNTAADGSGSAFTGNTVVTGNITVYAQWEKISSLTAKDILGGKYAGNYIGWYSDMSEQVLRYSTVEITKCSESGQFSGTLKADTVKGQGYDGDWYFFEISGSIDFSTGRFSFTSSKLIDGNLQNWTLDTWTGTITKNSMSGIVQNDTRHSFNLTRQNVPADAVQYNGHSYKAYDQSMTWREAKAFCEARGGHLATVTTASEHTFVTDLAKSGTMLGYWLGATDEETEGKWKWITGETWSYSNWDWGQPDNQTGIQNYLVLRSHYNWKWDDVSNEVVHIQDQSLASWTIIGLICEWENT